MFEKTQEKIMKAYIENPDRFSFSPIRLFLSKDNYEKLMHEVEAKRLWESLGRLSALGIEPFHYEHFQSEEDSET